MIRIAIALAVAALSSSTANAAETRTYALVAAMVLATRFVELVEKSTRDAVMRSEMRGRVEVNERGVR